MLSKEEVEHIAKLARLELTDKEIEKMQKDLSEILEYFNLLKKAPSPKKDSVARTEGRKSLRGDIVESSYEIKEKIIGQAPDKKDDYIKVKGIL